MHLGNQNVSEVQRNLLARARGARSTVILYELLRQVVGDSDLRADKEDVHPDWVDIFLANQEQLAKDVPTGLFSPIKSAFDALSALDPTLGTINPRNQKIAFLLGAGASKPPPSNIPVVKELLAHLLERARRLDREDVDNLADFCVARKITNIEDLLTAAQLATFVARSGNMLALTDYLIYGARDRRASELLTDEFEERRQLIWRNRPANISAIAHLQDTLQVLFGLLASTMLPAKPNAAHKAIADYSKGSTSASIITTNYDCCMDLALKESGRIANYCLEFHNQTPTDTVHNAIRVVKLHGSLNWFYCQTCRKLFRWIWALPLTLS